MALLLLAFLIATLTTSAVVGNRLMAQAKSDLNEQAIGVITALENSSRFDINEPRQVLSYLRKGDVGSLLPSDVYLVTPKHRLIYASNDSVSETQLNTIVKGEHPDYIRVIKSLEADGAVVGHLILTTEIKHIEAYIATLRLSLGAGMLVALIMGAALAAFMGRSIVGPIMSLKRDVGAYKDDPKHHLSPIHTGDEIQELYEAYEEMIQSIDAHMDERKRFFQNASHELKTPLMSIQGYAEAIKDGVVEGDEVNQSLEIIVGKSKQLKQTVEGLVYLSKLANEDLSYGYASMNLLTLIEGVIEDQVFVAADRGIAIQTDFPPAPITLSLDKEKFESVIENLLSNALRYAHSLVKIVVTDEMGTVHIRVIDDGPGLKKGEEQKVFERFYKGEGGHSGIGLAIVEEIVRSHKGSIQAANHISGGAVFAITLHKETNHD